MAGGAGQHILNTIAGLKASNTRLRDALVLAGFRLSDSEKEVQRLRILLLDLGVDKDTVSGDNTAAL